MNKEELVEREYRLLNSLSKDYVFRVEDILSSIRNEKVKLWITELDRYRLLTLRTWELKYKISLKTILQVLLPFWQGFIKRRTKTKGLGIRVSTLVGKKSEEILIMHLNKVYPRNEHKMLYISQEQERITQVYLKQLERSDGIRSQSDPSSLYTEDGRPKTLVDFGSPDAFIKYYRKWIKKEQLAREQLRDIMRKNKHRNNVYFPEVI